MGLDQEILVMQSHYPVDMYARILEQRKCYPLHGFVNKWLVNRYGLDFRDWKNGPFGPYIAIPRKIIKQFCVALQKRRKCDTIIPPLVRWDLENRLSPDLTKLLGSYVGGQCKYDQMFGDLSKEDWDYYPADEQKKDVLLLGEAVETYDIHNDCAIHSEFYYYASW
jgi:hypothetical protein